MGNHVSCTLAGSGIVRKHVKASRVIMSSGEIKQFLRPTKVAELMLDIPNFFVVNTKCLKIGQHFPALNADAELETGNIYAMFTMKRLSSKVTGGDMGALLIAANAAAKRSSSGKVRVLPECHGFPDMMDADGANHHVEGNKVFESQTKLHLEDIEEYCTPEFRHRMSLTRSRKPVLETIVEESSICVR